MAKTSGAFQSQYARKYDVRGKMKKPLLVRVSGTSTRAEELRRQLKRLKKKDEK